MNQDEWIKQLHDKLADREVAAPEGLWDDIEAALSQSVVPQKARFMTLRRWAVAASVAALLATGVYWWWPQEAEVSQQVSQNARTETPQRTSVVEAIEQESTLTPQAVTPIRRNKVAHAIEEKAPAVEELPVPAAVEEEPQDTEPTPTTTKPTTENTYQAIVRQLDEQITRLSVARHRTVNINLYAMNGFGTQTGSNGVIMSPQMADKFRHLTRGNDVIYLAGYEERQKHYQPISIGLTVGYPLTDRLFLSSGIVFTKLQSDFYYIMPSQQLRKEQRLYYLGIPLNLNYRLLSYKGLKVYASAGGQADWNISTKLQINGVSQEMAKDRMQWSVNGGLGLQYDIIPQLGLYAEPGLKYYFDNGSNVQNFFKDKPLNFNLQLGLRLNLND